MDETNNSTGVIIYEVEVNIYFKNYVERMRMDVCNLDKTDIILGMPQLQAHNPEINWETEEVRMIRYPSMCEVNTKRKKRDKRS